MYVQLTKYYCPKCRSHNHWGDEVCPKDADGGLSRLAPSGTETEPINGNVKSSDLREQEALPSAIRKAQEFIKKVGRPRVFSDPEARRRERHRDYMRKRRAGKSGSLG